VREIIRRSRANKGTREKRILDFPKWVVGRENHDGPMTRMVTSRHKATLRGICPLPRMRQVGYGARLPL
jgi:hypothetical protein